MKDLIKDKDGKVCTAKMAYIITLLTCLAKVFMQDTPNYSGLALYCQQLANNAIRIKAAENAA